MSATPEFTVPVPEPCERIAPLDRVRLLVDHYPYVLAFGIGLIYLSFLTRNYYWDGITFATSIENAGGFNGSLIHPHHLLYNVLGYALYRFAQLVGWHGRAIDLLQLSTAMFSVGCAVLLYRFLICTLKSRALAFALVATFSFSATWWKYSTDADAYIPSVLFLLIALNLLLAVRNVRPVSIAFAHTAAMCLHQLAVFFLPAVLVGLLLDKTYTLRQRVVRSMTYCTIAACTTLSINYYCFHLTTGSYAPSGFAKWLTNYLQGPDAYSFSFNLLSNLRYTLRAQIRVLFEGRIKWLQGLLSFPILILLAVLLAVVVLLFMRLIKHVRRFRINAITFDPDAKLRPTMFVAIAWLAAYIAFLFFWYPYFTPYRIFCLPAAILLVGVFLVHKQPHVLRARASTLGLLAAAMALSNFLFFIFPLTHSNKYPPLEFAMNLAESWSHNTIVFYRKSNADNQLVRYFNPNTIWLPIDEKNSVPTEDQVRAAYQSGGNVWLETTALDDIQASLSGKQWLSAHAQTRCRKELSAKGYSMKFQQVFPADLVVKAGTDCSLMASLHEEAFK